MSHHHKLHNQVYVGPGIWFAMHTDAAWANTIDRKKCVIEQIKNKQATFPCSDCKYHFGEYIRTHPLENTLDNNPESLFAWTVAFHNAVNQRLRKPIVPYADAKKIFYENSEFCSMDCDSSKPATPPKIIPRDLPGYIF